MWANNKYTENLVFILWHHLDTNAYSIMENKIYDNFKRPHKKVTT